MLRGSAEWCARLKERREVRRKQIQEMHEAIVKSLEAGLFVAKKEMLEQPCAIHDFQNCIEICAHFRDGFIRPHHSINTGVWFSQENPRCRLWGEK